MEQFLFKFFAKSRNMVRKLYKHIQKCEIFIWCMSFLLLNKTVRGVTNYKIVYN